MLGLSSCQPRGRTRAWCFPSVLPFDLMISFSAWHRELQEWVGVFLPHMQHFTLGLNFLCCFLFNARSRDWPPAESLSPELPPLHPLPFVYSREGAGYPEESLAWRLPLFWPCQLVLEDLSFAGGKRPLIFVGSDIPSPFLLPGLCVLHLWAGPRSWRVPVVCLAAWTLEARPSCAGRAVCQPVPSVRGVFSSSFLTSTGAED